MNNELFRYIDDQMTPEEKAGFELKLQSDSLLRKEFDEVQAMLQATSKLNVKPDLTRYHALSRQRVMDKTNGRAKAGVLFSHRGSLVFAMTVLMFFAVFFNRHLLTPSESGLAAEKDAIPEQGIVEYLKQEPAEEMVAKIEENQSVSNQVEDLLRDELSLDASTSIALLDEMNVSSDEIVDGLKDNDLDELTHSSLKK